MSGIEVVYIEKDSETYEDDLHKAKILYDKSDELIEQVKRGAPLNWKSLSMRKPAIIYIKNIKMISILVFHKVNQNDIEISVYASERGYGFVLFKFFLNTYMDKNIFLTNGEDKVQEKYLTYITDGRPPPELDKTNGKIIWRAPSVVETMNAGKKYKKLKKTKNMKYYTKKKNNKKNNKKNKTRKLKKKYLD